MGIDRYLTLCVLILVSLCVFTHSEIHRTKPNWNKSLNRQKIVTENSYVASSHEEQEDNSNSTQSENMVERLEIWCCSILGAVLVGLSGIFPLLVIPIEAGPQLKHGAAAAKLKLLLSFAVGGLLGDVFLHLLPEAWDHLDKESQGHDGHMKIGMWVIAGLMCFLIIEKMFAKENEHDHLDTESSEESTTNRQTDSVENTNGVKHRTKNKQAKSKHKTKNSNNKVKSDKSENSTVNSSQNTIKVSGYLNLAANVIDNFTHGLAVAGGFLVSMKVGLITTVAILLHEIPHEVGDFAILLRSGFDRWKAAKAQLLTATGGTIGALTALMADSAQAAGDSTVWILPFTSGGFLYIALVTVVPDLLEEKNPRESIKQTVCLISGIFVMYLVSLVH